MIPEKIKIGGMFYRVSENRKLARDRDSSGESCGNDLWITIDTTLSRQNQETTLLHEIIEQINAVYDLDLEHHKISLLEAALYQVIMDNPDILNFKREV